MSVYVVATIKALPEAAEALKAEMLELIPKTIQESGCIQYFLHQDNTDPNTFIFYEQWSDDEALQKHLASPHLQAFLKSTQGRTADFAVNKLTRLA